MKHLRQVFLEFSPVSSCSIIVLVGLWPCRLKLSKELGLLEVLSIDMLDGLPRSHLGREVGMRAGRVGRSRVGSVLHTASEGSFELFSPEFINGDSPFRREGRRFLNELLHALQCLA